MTCLKELSTGNYRPDWCPGCGNYVILQAVKQALVNLNIKKEDVVITSGIGCSSKFPQWINTFGLHGLHGRGIPMALGVKMANKRLKVIVIGGDGDVYGEGLNHFMEAIRDNIDISLLVHNNKTYGLTKGQASPTTPRNKATSSTPNGNLDYPMNPISLAVSQECGFVARSTTADIKHLTRMIEEAISYEGFSFLDILQECVTFNKGKDAKWYRENTYKLKGHNVGNKWKALEKSMDEGKIGIGIFYSMKKKTFGDMHSVLSGRPLVKRDKKVVKLDKLFNEFCY